MTNTAGCLDCGAAISTSAVLCPHCGRQYKPMNISRAGWSGTVAWGVILSWLLPLIVGGILMFLFFSVIVGALSSGRRP